MRDKIEQFLRENLSESFKAGEIARQLEMPKGEVKKRLKRLAKQGRVENKDGRYLALDTVVATRSRSSGVKKPAARKSQHSAPKAVPATPDAWTTGRLEETARSVGISVESLQKWVEEKRKSASAEESEKLIYGVMNDLERSKGTKAKNQPEK